MQEEWKSYEGEIGSLHKEVFYNLQVAPAIEINRADAAEGNGVNERKEDKNSVEIRWDKGYSRVP